MTAGLADSYRQPGGVFAATRRICPKEARGAQGMAEQKGQVKQAWKKAKKEGKQRAATRSKGERQPLAAAMVLSIAPDICAIRHMPKKRRRSTGDCKTGGIGEMKRSMRALTGLMLAAILALTGVAGFAIAETGTAENAGKKLDRVVVLSRHNIRSPLSGSGSALGELTPHAWFDWTSNPSELSLRGAMLETTMGQYFRLWLEDEGLFPENYRPEDGAVRFYANAKQRTRATAHYFSAGLLPVVDVEVEQHAEYDTMDPVFTPKLTFVSDAYEADVRAQVAELGGVAGMDGISAGLRDAMELLMDVADVAESEAYRSGKYGDLLEDGNEVTLSLDDEPKLSGPIKTATSLADALTLQYYEEPDAVKAAFGHELTLGDWQMIHSIVDTYSDMLFTTPLVCVNVAHPLLEEIRSELVAEGRKFSFLCGHDSNVASVLAALGVEDYLLPEAVEQHTPIGVKLVFERWLDADGAAWYDVSLVYQSVDQLRGLTPLTLENPPVKYQLRFKGVETDADGMMAEAELMKLLDGAIGAYDALVEKYGAETALAPAA